MEIKVIENAVVLIPNEEHKNFTATKEEVSPGTTLQGDYYNIKGMRRGQPFQYRLFKINKTNKYIFTNKTKPNKMEKTEITLGADAQVSPTKVSVPNNTKIVKEHMIGALIGAGAGFGFAKYRKVEGNAKWIYMGVGAVAGYLVGRMIAKKKDVTIKTSK